jgi:hypothetical protein
LRGFGIRLALSKSVKTKLMSGERIQLSLFGSRVDGSRRPAANSKEAIMKKVALIVLSVCMAVPTFASDAVGHSVAVAGKDTGKAAAVAGKDSGKAAAVAGKDSGKAAAVAGKDSGKAAAVAGKDTGKATVKAVKSLF